MSKWLTLNELIRAEEEIRDRSESDRDSSGAYECKDALLFWTGFPQTAETLAMRFRPEIY